MKEKSGPSNGKASKKVVKDRIFDVSKMIIMWSRMNLATITTLKFDLIIRGFDWDLSMLRYFRNQFHRNGKKSHRIQGSSIFPQTLWLLIASPMSRLMMLGCTNSFALFRPKFNGHLFPSIYHINVSSLMRHVSSTTALSFCQLQASKLHDSPVTVASDVRYGGKRIISVDSPLYDYILSNVREPKVNAQILRELREETATMRGSQMQVSPDQAQLLAMLVQILGAKRCIEVGTYTIRFVALDQDAFDNVHLLLLYLRTHDRSSLSMEDEGNWVSCGRRIKDKQGKGYVDIPLLGYSSLGVALVLPEGGCLVACERDGKSIEVAQRYYDRAGVSHKVDVRHGLAADTLKSLIQNGEICRYDFAFVDAEKRMYQEYFELLLQLVRVGGLIVVDNVLWHGRVSDPLVNDSKTLSIRDFNENLMKDNRVDISMVPVGDEEPLSSSMLNYLSQPFHACLV
ncbi:putative protein FAM32A-like [Capsicum annuum]|nr:putative protein FAM32A-like [Capsicum annuum]